MVICLFVVVVCFVWGILMFCLVRDCGSVFVSVWWWLVVWVGVCGYWVVCGWCCGVWYVCY